MADPEHLEILKKGVEVWNQWRIDHICRPDLSGAKLANADLGGFRFWQSDLSCTDLRNAILLGAQFNNANLRGADLRNSLLTGAVFFNTLLSETDFAGAHLATASFHQVDLGKARNLSRVAEGSLCYIEMETLERTAKSLSEQNASRAEFEIFLRRSGAPEHYIDTFRYQVANPIEFYSAFISYSHADRSFARRLNDGLQLAGIKCWLDWHKVLPGDDFHDAIDRGIRLWDKVVLCCSNASLTSWWVGDEIDKALEKERKLLKERGERVRAIIPLDLDGYLFEWEDARCTTLCRRLAADFTGWETDSAKFDDQFKRLITALRSDEGAREKAPESRL